MKIEVYASVIKDVGLKRTEDLLELLVQRGDEVWLDCETDREFKGVIRGNAPSPEILIVLGGDGTIMRAARRGAVIGVPILGIDLGRLGYLAELSPDDKDGLMAVLDGDYHIEKRSLLETSVVKNGVETDEAMIAINDVVISHGKASHLLEVEILCDASSLGRYRADGFIVSTPTGSTAYSLAAGGPVISPRLNGMCLTPICPHSLTARPIIVPDDSLIEIRYLSPSNSSSSLTIDGIESDILFCGDSLKIRKSNLTADFIRVSRKREMSFYEVLRTKMSDL